MAIYNIVTEGDPVLRKSCEQVRRFDERLHTMLDNMAETMYDAPGVGLAAPQIGVSKRIVVIDVGEGLVELINPVIVERSGFQTGEEGCLSVPDMGGVVTRSMHVKVEAQDRFGEPIVVEGDEFFARALQHEIDHLDGILYIDKLDPGTELFRYE